MPGWRYISGGVSQNVDTSQVFRDSHDKLVWPSWRGETLQSALSFICHPVKGVLMRVPSSLRVYLLAGCFFLLAMIAGNAMADDASPVLTLTEGTESRELTLEQIEAPGLHAVEMRHPEGPEGTFSGVWLDDFLAAQGLEEAPRVRFTALDGYTTFLTPAQRREKRYLLVTRLDGEPVSEASLGPLMLVVPKDAEAAREGSAPMTRWIWAIGEVSVR